MTPADYARLVALAAIWGASFLFIRVAAPALGPIATADARVLIGGLALVAWFRAIGFDAGLRRHWRLFVLIGFFGSGLPFALYAFAGMHLPASLMAILNATAPMFGLVLGALFAAERITLAKIAGLALGAFGVYVIAQPEGFDAGPLFGWAVAACLGACLAYGITGVLMKRLAAGVPSRSIAAGNQLAAAAMLAPFLLVLPPPGVPGPLVIANVLLLGVLASGVAFVLYFRLMQDVGPVRALTVTFLIPPFGLLWGWLFLGETLPAAALGGAVSIIAGTLLVTRG